MTSTPSATRLADRGTRVGVSLSWWWSCSMNLANEKRALRVLTNEKRVLPGQHDGLGGVLAALDLGRRGVHALDKHLLRQQSVPHGLTNEKRVLG